MKTSKITDRAIAEIRAILASYQVSTYYGLPRKRCEVAFSPDEGKPIERELTFADGTSLTLTRRDEAHANINGVTFTKRPDRIMAEHELAHFYHIVYNHSVRQSIEQHQKMIERIRDGESIPTGEYLENHITHNFGAELLPNAHVHRHDNCVHLGRILTFPFEKGTSSDAYKAGILEKLSSCLEQLLLGSESDLEQARHNCGNNETYRSIITLFMTKLYILSQVAGPLLLVEPESKPTIYTQVGLNSKNPNELALGFCIEYPLLQPGQRRGILNNVFREDIHSLQNRGWELYQRLIGTLLPQCYREISDKVHRIKIPK
jgi:hypothetical protein